MRALLFACLLLTPFLVLLSDVTFDGPGTGWGTPERLAPQMSTQMTSLPSDSPTLR